MAKVISGLHFDNLLTAIEIIENSITDKIKNELPVIQINKIIKHLLGLKGNAITLFALNKKKKMFVEKKRIVVIDGKKETKKNINVQIEKIKIEIAKMIKHHNMHVQKLRKNAIANLIPTIKSKISDKTKNAMINGKDTIDAIDYGPEITSVSLCSRKRGGKTDGHFLVIKENLIGLLNAYLNVDNINLWNLINDCQPLSFPTNWKLVYKVTNMMAIKCQGKPACDKMIRLNVLFAHLTFVERKTFRAKYIALYLALLKIKYGDKINIYYCKNVKCVCANTGFLFIPAIIENNGNDIIFCEKCNTRHYVHLHKIECSLCNYSFCSTCEHHPYHSDRVCYGVVSDDVKLLLLSSSTCKPCPGCKLPYEKDGGCDHVTCQNMECNTHWCWRCLQKLNSKDPYLHTCLSINAVATNIDGAYRDFYVDVDDDIPDLEEIPLNNIQNQIIVPEQKETTDIWTSIKQMNTAIKVTIGIACGYIILVRFTR
jgi:hypothetical protein